MTFTDRNSAGRAPPCGEKGSRNPHGLDLLPATYTFPPQNSAGRIVNLFGPGAFRGFKWN